MNLCLMMVTPDFIDCLIMADYRWYSNQMVIDNRDGSQKGLRLGMVNVVREYH